jgi:hypothetical protein
LAYQLPFLQIGKKADSIELNYLGKYKEMPVFEVVFNNNGAEKEYVVTIMDDNKNVLYRDYVKSGTTSKKYALDTKEVGDSPLQFEISAKNAKTSVVYAVNRKSRLVEDVVVNKL